MLERLLDVEASEHGTLTEEIELICTMTGFRSRRGRCCESRVKAEERRAALRYAIEHLDKEQRELVT